MALRHVFDDDETYWPRVNLHAFLTLPVAANLAYVRIAVLLDEAEHLEIFKTIRDRCKNLEQLHCNLDPLMEPLVEFFTGWTALKRLRVGLPLYMPMCQRAARAVCSIPSLCHMTLRVTESGSMPMKQILEAGHEYLATALGKGCAYTMCMVILCHSQKEARSTREEAERLLSTRYPRGAFDVKAFNTTRIRAHYVEINTGDTAGKASKLHERLCIRAPKHALQQLL